MRLTIRKPELNVRISVLLVQRQGLFHTILNKGKQQPNGKRN